ncbi:hypothetical protein GGR60_003401 [Xanthomonas arboricola]|uniref:hypothetical protein n=1 Tax=Xanthomonas TaxID=338 RepID=UPI00142FB305|nr:MULTISPECIES: hypothetical protein [Xanthomonas]MDX6081232.1 hypothetical protein [Xanthomonas campestris pv. incanae]MDX6086764.1 hypothetical protein [Xanthomonas campestris pv. incanae]MDX6139112.1 hypothetical protein [Xanthomonas campestris pv. incanae]NJC38847.1 hypothetical protein [Xanthomonas euroxanthea]WHO93668.1 hypothetical protein QMY62_05495 [Xanthomonas campestris]
MTRIVYIGHPLDATTPGITAAVTAFFGSVAFKDANPDWSHRVTFYDKNNSLKTADFCSRIKAHIGPVLLVRPLRNPDIGIVQRELGTRTPVSVHNAYDNLTLAEAWRLVKTAVDNGEPLLPANFVTALLLMNKLDSERKWTGYNDKGYMWTDDLPKGRGFDEKFRAHLPLVLTILFQCELITNKTSKGKTKWALNPNKRSDIYKILRLRDFREFDVDVHARLSRPGHGSYSAMELEILGEFIPEERKS